MSYLGRRSTIKIYDDIKHQPEGVCNQGQYLLATSHQPTKFCALFINTAIKPHHSGLKCSRKMFICEWNLGSC